MLIAPAPVLRALSAWGERGQHFIGLGADAFIEDKP